MSDSEDDFMSDKFLVDAPQPSTGKTYSAQRSSTALKNLRAGQAKNAVPLKQLEKERREEGLRTSLFERKEGQGEGSGSGSGGGNKAMEMMMKMGWKVGEGLGKRSAPDEPEADEREDEDVKEFGREVEGAEGSGASARMGIGAGAKKGKGKGAKRFRPGLDEDEDDQEEKTNSNTNASTNASTGRVEPLRISLWSGRRGLGLLPREQTPPLPTKSAGQRQRDPDALDPDQLERLGRATEGFRERQRAEYGEREVERKEKAARGRLVELDVEKGTKYHPLHALPSDPLHSLPLPLLRLIYPAQVFSPSPSPSSSPKLEPITTFDREENVSAAHRIREQMRRDMLSSLGDDEDGEGEMRFGVLSGGGVDEQAKKVDGLKRGQQSEKEGQDGKADEYAGVDWEDMVDGTKRVLSMDPATHLTFLVSQLRHEHLFCFWCAYKYGSYEEMEGAGGCPGEEEDDH